jgi:hypothetical protein
MLVAIAALGAATYVTFWDSSNTNYALILGIYVLVVSLTTTGAIFSGPRFRPAFVATSLFGTAYLVFVLKGGFGLQYFHDAQALVKSTTAGFLLLATAFLSTQLFVMVTRQSSDKEQRNGDPPGVL